MVNNTDAIISAHWAPMLQDFLNNRLVARPLARTEFGVDWSFGDTVHFNYINEPTVQTYTPETDLDIADTDAVDDTLVINTRKAATFKIDRTVYRQVTPKYIAELADQSAYVLNNYIDQSLISTGVNGANYTIAGGGLSAATMYTQMLSIYARLERSNACDVMPFAIITPDHAALLAGSFVQNGFNEADRKLEAGFKRLGEAAGFMVYVSNNCPHTGSLELDVEPNDGDQVQLFGVTFTFVTTLGSTPGNVLIGANLAAAQANFVAAVTGAAGAGSTYVELAKEDRAILSNAQVSAAAFSSDVSVLTAFGRIEGTMPVNTAGSVGFGTETASMLFGRPQSMSLGIQIDKELIIGQEPKKPVKNYMNFILCGFKAFARDQRRMVRLTATY